MNLRNEQLAIIEIQQNLLELFEAGYDLPYVIPDGIYGSVTRKAVSEFQRTNKIPSTGIVDFETWTLLTNAALAAVTDRRDASGIFPFSVSLSSGKIKKGEKFDLVAIVRIMLGQLSGFDYEDTVISGIFDDDLEKRIIDFQKLNLIEPTGEINKETWNKLAASYNNSLAGSPDK